MQTIVKLYSTWSLNTESAPPPPPLSAGRGASSAGVLVHAGKRRRGRRGGVGEGGAIAAVYQPPRSVLLGTMVFLTDFIVRLLLWKS